MDRRILIVSLCLAAGLRTWCGEAHALADPLVFRSGGKVTSREEWRERRAEILELFQREMYGRMPPKPAAIETELLDERETCCGFGIRRRVRMRFRPDRSGPFVDWTVIRPKNARSACPPIVLLNPIGDFQLLPDEDLGPAEGFVNEHPDRATERAAVAEKPGARGIWCSPSNRYHWPIGTILARGFAIVTASYFDIAPDPGENCLATYRRRCFELWPDTVGLSDDTRSLMAWAWGLCRGLDLAENEPGLDASRAIVTGCSRLGKAALIAGAFDERFKVVVPNQTGKGGVPLTCHIRGETIDRERKSFPHWYAPPYLEYAGRDAEIPYDQHLLLACVAPRALLVEGFDSSWFDPEGEYLSVAAASRVWEFLGAPGLPAGKRPEMFDTAMIGTSLGYVWRNGKHGLWAYDWEWLMNFASRHFGLKD